MNTNARLLGLVLRLAVCTALLAGSVLLVSSAARLM